MCKLAVYMCKPCKPLVYMCKLCKLADYTQDNKMQMMMWFGASTK